MFVVKNESFEFMIELTSTTSIDINKRDKEFKSSLERVAWTQYYVSFNETLLNYKVDV